MGSQLVIQQQLFQQIYKDVKPQEYTLSIISYNGSENWAQALQIITQSQSQVVYAFGFTNCVFSTIPKQIKYYQLYLSLLAKHIIGVIPFVSIGVCFNKHTGIHASDELVTHYTPNAAFILLKQMMNGSQCLPSAVAGNHLL